jgi:starvation-inducible DNA-binding protein
MNPEGPDNYSKEGLAQALAKHLGTTIVAQYMAHGYHWNVKGPEFTQFHDFFGEVYEDWTSVEDRVAEYIRILGYDAPHSLQEFLALACLDSKPAAGNPLEMTANLYEANIVLLNCVTDIFELATAINDQGIANWAAERMDAHSKWNWKLGTTIGADSMQIQSLPTDMGKSKAEVLLEVVDNDNDMSLPELQPTPESMMLEMLEASGGAGAPAELIDPRKIRKALSAAGHLVPEEQDLADALLEIVKEHGKFNDDNTGVWVGYTPASENEDHAAIGVKCGNCVFFNAPNGCSIIEAAVEDGGLCRLAVLPDGAVTATAGSKPAPKKDQIKGSDKNKKGSAATGRKVTFSKAVEESLKEKVSSHNESVSADDKKVTLSMLKAVYRRGAGAFSSSHRPDQNRNSWAMGRVNAYLHLVKAGKPANAKYTTDNDLLPEGHPKSTNSSKTLTASAFADRELYIELSEESMYESPEQALVAMAEYSGLGYESIPVFRAAWRRGVANNESAFDRAARLAIDLYNSEDSDLLPKQEQEDW